MKTFKHTKLDKCPFFYNKDGIKGCVHPDPVGMHFSFSQIPNSEGYKRIARFSAVLPQGDCIYTIRGRGTDAPPCQYQYEDINENIPS